MRRATGDTESERGGRLRGMRRDARRVLPAAEREQATDQQLERVDAESAGDRREVLAAGRSEQRLDGALRLARLQQRRGERLARPVSEEAVVELPPQRHALLREGDRGVHIALGEHRLRLVEQVEREHLVVAGQPSCFDGAVEQLGSLAGSARHQRDGAQQHGEDREQRSLAGCPRDCDGSRTAPLGLAVSVQVHLRGREARRGVEPRAQLLVGQRVDERGGVPAVAVGFGDGSGAGARQGERRGGGRGQGRVVERVRAVPCAHRPSVHRLVPHPVEGVCRELQHERDPLRRVVPELAQGAGEALVRLVVPAEQTLDPRAGDDQLHARRGALAGYARKALEQRGMTVGELAARRQGARQGEQELDPLAVRGGLGQQPQRAAEPATGARRCPWRRGVTRRPQDRHRVGVTLAGEAFHVRCSRHRGSRRAPTAQPRRARARSVASRERSPRRPPGARAGDGTRTDAAPPSGARDRAAAARRARPRTSGSASPADAAASSRSNGSPATAAPSKARRAVADNPASSSVSAAATIGGTMMGPKPIGDAATGRPGGLGDLPSCSR